MNTKRKFSPSDIVITVFEALTENEELANSATRRCLNSTEVAGYLHYLSHKCFPNEPFYFSEYSLEVGPESIWVWWRSQEEMEVHIKNCRKCFSKMVGFLGNPRHEEKDWDAIDI